MFGESGVVQSLSQRYHCQWGGTWRRREVLCQLATPGKSRKRDRTQRYQCPICESTFYPPLAIRLFTNFDTKADLNGDGRADYLWLNETNGAVIAYLNTGSGNKMSWAPLNDAKEIASGGGPGAGVRFADISGSGKAGYLFVEDSGAVHLYANGGPDSKGGWLWLGPRQIASGVPNAKQDNVFFPDLNGDGRADYVVIGQKGEVTLWLNIGSSLSYDITWVPLGEVASGLNTPNISLVDISGDGRADYMIWDQLGGLTGYLNARGPKEVPVWLDQGADKSIGTGVSESVAISRRLTNKFLRPKPLLPRIELADW